MEDSASSRNAQAVMHKRPFAGPNGLTDKTVQEKEKTAKRVRKRTLFIGEFWPPFKRAMLFQLS